MTLGGRAPHGREAEGLLHIADVGQDAWEEVNAVEADSGGCVYRLVER